MIAVRRLSRTQPALALLLVAIVAVVCALVAAPAPAFAGAATWSGFEQPIPSGSSWPVSLGKVGDIEFWQSPGEAAQANRGLLITAGEPPTVQPGLWAYNGVGWHELTHSEGDEGVCGATDGRIAWAGPGEFWTVSDGRAGEANEVTGSGLEHEVSHEDNTLCHFAHGEVVASYAHPADQPDSYQAMRAAACLSPTDCWFGGNPLEAPQIGAFHLHWNGSSVENEPYLGEGHTVDDMVTLEGLIYESVQILSTDRVTEQEAYPPVLHRIDLNAVSQPIEPETGLEKEALDEALYESNELPRALSFLRLSAADGTLWAAAGKAEPVESSHKAGQVTVVRKVGSEWTQLIGSRHPLKQVFPSTESEEETSLLEGEAKNAAVSAFAVEPGIGGAWMALAPPKNAGTHVVLVHVNDEGEVGEEHTLPSAEEEAQGIGPKGTATTMTCPAAEDCWLATTQGWLFHLARPNERTLEKDPREEEYFKGLIAYRPPDLGLPQVVPDAPPPDTSGLTEEAPDYGGAFAETKPLPIETKVSVPLLTGLHSRLIHKTTLELRFHLAVKARVRLLAERRKKVVASTPMRTLQAGNRKLLLRLNPRDWPTKLSLQTHPLASLPSTTVKEAVGGPEHGGSGAKTETTGLTVLPQVPTFAELGSRP